jgi:hypothetical protein
MFPFVIALILLAAAVGAIYLLLKNMGDEGIEVAAPGSCKSGRCGVRCGTTTDTGRHEEEEQFADTDNPERKDAA